MNKIKITKTEFAENDFSVLDFETTGTSFINNRVIEVGIVKIRNLKIVDTYQKLINPNTQIPSFISQLTGITNIDIKNAPSFSDIHQELLEFIGDSILVAHNLQFDLGFLNSELQRCGVDKIHNKTLCTLKLARKIYTNLKSKSLSNLTKSLRIKHNDAHRALSDANVTAKILIKIFKKLVDQHNITTIDETIRFQGLPSRGKGFRLIKKKLADTYLSLPDSPGVYFYRDRKGKIIYIGKAKSLKKRISNYFSNSADYKAKKIIRKASSLTFQKTNSELSALLAETQLIKLNKPPLNTMLKKYSQQYFLKFRITHPTPDLRVTSKFDFDGCDYFGPYNNRDTAAKLKEIIDRTFFLRECKDVVLKKKKLCYLYDIHRCLAPCAFEISSDYTDEMQKVYDFLSNKNQHAIDRLLKKMKQLSQDQKYEEAAQYRDTVNLILTQLNKSSIISEPINTSKCLIEVYSPIHDYLLFLEGRIYIKNDIANSKDHFEDALNDYFSGSLRFIDDVKEKDLDLIKISLSWLVKNRTKVKIYYLNEFNSKDHLYKSLKN